MSETLTFNPERHEYRLGDQVLPHVTQVTDSLQSYSGVSDKVMREAADRGRAVHLATQLWDEDDLDVDSLPDTVRPYLDAWIRFREETGFEPGLIEFRVHSRTFGYAGTLDRTGSFHKLRGIRPDQPALIDLKATYKIMAAVGPQTAGYLHALHETLGNKITRRRFAVQLKPDGTYRLEECKDPSDWSVFLSALTLTNWRARHAA